MIEKIVEKNQSYVMKNSIRSIHEAGYGKRLIAMIMDAVVFAFVTVALALWVFQPIVNSTMHYEDLGVKGLQYEVFSKLFVAEEEDENGNKHVVEISNMNETKSSLTYTVLYQYGDENTDVNLIKERLHYYYCCYKTGENIETIEGKDVNDFRAPDYNKYIKDNNGNDVLPKDYYTDAWFNKLIEGKTTLKDFRSLSYDAVGNLRSTSYFTEVNNKISQCQLVMILPPFFISFLGFYLLVPLLYKNGETFGKKVMKIGFASKDGFEVKKRQIVFRQILLLAWVCLSCFIVGIGLTSLATLGVGVVIYLIATVISKTKRSPIDYAAYTYLIDTAKSVWFKNAKIEEEKELELEEKMSKYRKYEPDQSHVIQVGSEIVNEDIKKELEEEKVKKSKK